MTNPTPQETKAEAPKSLYPLPRSFQDPRWMTKNILSGPGDKIACITHMDVLDTSDPVTTRAGYEFLCSYSWKPSIHSQPTIYVPGTPPLWTPPSLPIQLQQDRGMHWTDQHGHRVPRFQFEPLFQALAVMNPTVRFDSVDVVVNRNTLQKLHTFAALKRSYRQFYLNLNMVGSTLFVSRIERNAMEKARGGYGRNFENLFTSGDPAVMDAEGHHRVVRYDLGGLNVVVRLEADGYLGDEDLLASTGTVESEGDTSRTPAPLNEFFLNLLQTVGPGSAAIAHHNPQHTHVIPRGTLVPHNSSLELKSNNAKHKAKEQIWFGRVPHVVFGRHDKGLISTVERIDWQQEDFEAWAIKNQRSLRRLVWLLREIRRLVMEGTDGKAVLVAMEKGSPLQVFPMKEGYGALPREVVERFWDTGEK